MNVYYAQQPTVADLETWLARRADLEAQFRAAYRTARAAEAKAQAMPVDTPARRLRRAALLAEARAGEDEGDRLFGLWLALEPGHAPKVYDEDRYIRRGLPIPPERLANYAGRLLGPFCADCGCPVAKCDCEAPPC